MCSLEEICPEASTSVQLNIGPNAGNSSVEGFSTSGPESGMHPEFKMLVEHRDKFKELVNEGRIVFSPEGHAVMKYELESIICG